MPHYFVTMDIKTADPRLPLDQVARIVRAAILPSIEALVPLRSQGRLLTGGYVIGERSMMFIFEAESEAEVREVLDSLPLSGVAATPEVKQMQTIEDLSNPENF